MANLPENAITRKEKYLNAIATGNANDLPEPVTREEIYLDYIAENGSGGGSGVSYNDLTNKPKINNTELSGNVSLNALSLYSQNDIDTNFVAKETGKGLSSNDFTDTEKTKLAGIANGANLTVVDSALSSTSENPVQNKIINSALLAKANAADLSNVATSGNYNDLSNKPTIPTKTSDITNDNNYVNEIYVQDAISEAIGDALAARY